jgi:hypothetical protein
MLNRKQVMSFLFYLFDHTSLYKSILNILLDRLREVKSKSTFVTGNNGNNINNVVNNNDDDITFISIHVRRTDYAGFLSTFVNLSLADETYFDVATDYFRKRYKVNLF